jgi:AmmeMemoRadiSam system protein B
MRVAPGLTSKLVDDLDEALLLDNARFTQAQALALQAYRDAAMRPLTVDGDSLSRDPDEAEDQLRAFDEALSPEISQLPGQPVRGLVSPHIDYERGGAVYAEVWRAASDAVNEAELAIILGTDHQGAAGNLTLTRQSYATPWGMLPTDGSIVDSLASALGEESAYAEELHHRTEHSIELVAVWLHYTRNGRAIPTVPVLCGHFGEFIAGGGDPGEHEAYSLALEVLRDAISARRTIVVAAGDLAHVGPAFGDGSGLDLIGRAQQQNADGRLLESVCTGDAAGFYKQIKEEGDRRHICGLPPIYLTLRLLQNAIGIPAGYAICPADARGTSVVTIAGALLS